MSPSQVQSTPENDLSSAEDDHDLEHDGKGSKPGRKKNPNTQAARRDQNRIAQREFRLRKQQKIRDLEARVELLSGNKEETYSQMRDMMRALMAENVQLRNLLRDVSKFIGDSVGGPLSTSLAGIGWSLDTFQAFIHRGETDTAFDAFQTVKRNREAGPAANVSEEDTRSGKRRRTEEVQQRANGLGSYSAGPSSAAPNGISTAVAFASLMDTTSSPSLAHTGLSSTAFVPGRRASVPGPDAGTPSSVPAPFSQVVTSYLETSARPPINNRQLPNLQGSNPQPMLSTPAAPQLEHIFSSGEAQVEADDSSLRKNEAGQYTLGHGIMNALKEDDTREMTGRLIKYHLDNYRRNPSYCLPRSLQPTLVQSTIPHEQIIDGVPFPELRDRMILLKDRFSLVEVFHSLLTGVTLHGDDVLQHTNWELSRVWLEKYPFLLDEKTLAITNRWRKERGDPEISMAELLKEH